MWWRIRAWPGAAVALILDERERWVYWAPVLIGLGIALYFVLPFEPPWPLALLISLLLLGGGRWQRTQPWWFYVLLGLTCLSAGVTAANIRTALVSAPMLSQKLGPVDVVGDVSAREVGDDGSRLVLTNLEIEKLRPEQTPMSVRLTLRKSLELPPVGARIRVLANLLPPMEPSYPGGYDFRRAAFFQQIGAFGMILRAPEIVRETTGASHAEIWREKAAAAILSHVSGPEGAIAVALMTGERGAIDDTTNNNMRAAGTQHLLSISGMHIGMVGGFVFYLLRAILALFPVLALNYPIKRWAAVLALAVVVAYTWLVGAPIPAQRATLMAALVFVAIMLDRQAINMRSVALAAGLILLIFPESLLNPGFQMSFAAIVMLIAVYEWWHQRDKAEQKFSWWQRGWRYVAGIIATSLIAGFATMPYSAWHFHRLQLLGVIGNLLAVPLTGFIIMPAAVLAYPLMPFGVAGPVLTIMGWGLSGVTQSAAYVASLPFANIVAGQWSVATVVLMTLGGFWLAIWQSKIRWGGVVPILLGCILALTPARPLVLVSAEGKIALRGTDGALYVERLPAKGMTFEQWQLAYNDGHDLKAWRTSPESGVRCDALGCVMTAQKIALPEQLLAQEEDCTRARLVIAPELRLKSCDETSKIDRTTLRSTGSVMVSADGQLIASREGAHRPWQPGFGVSYTSGSARQGGPAP